MNTSWCVRGMCPNSTPARRMCTTTEYDDFFVYMEGRLILRAFVNLLIYRIRQQVMNTGTITAAWMRTWGLKEKGPNPPFRDVIAENLAYLRRFAMDSAYVDIQGTMESKRAYKRRLYSTLYHISRGATGAQEMRIIRIWPKTDWTTVSKNIHRTPVSGGMKAAWYKVINDILPTNDRLNKIRMSPTDKCRICGMQGTVQHHLIECEGLQIWQWIAQKLAHILRTTPNRIPSDWLLRPQCALWPPPRRQAVVYFRTRPNREPTQYDFIDFMQANIDCTNP